MDESAPIRAIVIGVSLFITIITISAVLMYYNTAKQMASNVGRGEDFAANYEQSIQDILLRGSYNVSGNNYITGTDVKNLLNYFYNNENLENDNVEIEVSNVKYITGYDSNKANIGGVNMSYRNANYSKKLTGVNSGYYEELMTKILPNQKFSIQNYKENSTLKNGNIGIRIVIRGL